MRGVFAAGGNHKVDWSIERILATADKLVGLDVLTRLHNTWGPRCFRLAGADTRSVSFICADVAMERTSPEPLKPRSYLKNSGGKACRRDTLTFVPVIRSNSETLQSGVFQ
jgi:hypothetical protein